MIENLIQLIQRKFESEGTGHDWFHINRVIQTALYIHKKEGGDLSVVHYAALLHDIDDHKFNGGDFSKGGKVAKELIKDHSLSESQHDNIVNIVKTISFKGSGEDDTMDTLEGKIVQDADRLDAIGAIGIARTFAYGGSIGQPIYIPGIGPKENQTKEEYLGQRSHTINHFYEKLLLIGDLMKTKTGTQLARERTEYMKAYLNRFLKEWDGFN